MHHNTHLEYFLNENKILNCLPDNQFHTFKNEKWPGRPMYYITELNEIYMQSVCNVSNTSYSFGNY